jgi:hypothetical protein
MQSQFKCMSNSNKEKSALKLVSRRHDALGGKLAFLGICGAGRTPWSIVVQARDVPSFASSAKNIFAVLQIPVERGLGAHDNLRR